MNKINNHVFPSLHPFSEGYKRLFTFSGLCLQAFTLLIMLSGSGIPSETEPISLQPKPLPFAPEEFYIADINDERKIKNAVAWLLPITNFAASSAEPVPVDLKGGAQNAIRLFVEKSLPANTALRPLIMGLKEISITEKPLEDGSVEGTVVVTTTFSLRGEEENKYLTEFRGNTRYVRSPRRHSVVAQALSQTLASSLKYINNWMNQEAPHNIRLAQGMKISFTDFTAGAEDDTVFYDPARPINWDDFLARPRNKKFEASIFPNFGYRNSSEVKDGYLFLDITFRVYMLKNISWVRDGARDAYGLNHEQRHFDLVKIVVERLKQKILMKGLSMEDYDGELGFLYLESYREMNKLQEQYDNETSHGTNQAAQERWNRKISRDLGYFGIETP